MWDRDRRAQGEAAILAASPGVCGAATISLMQIIYGNKKAAGCTAGGFSQDGSSATNARRQPD